MHLQLDPHVSDTLFGDVWVIRGHHSIPDFVFETGSSKIAQHSTYQKVAQGKCPFT